MEAHITRLFGCTVGLCTFQARYVITCKSYDVKGPQVYTPLEPPSVNLAEHYIEAYVNLAIKPNIPHHNTEQVCVHLEPLVASLVDASQQRTRAGLARPAVRSSPWHRIDLRACAQRLEFSASGSDRMSTVTPHAQPLKSASRSNCFRLLRQ